MVEAQIVDVICRCSRDGSLTPLKVRILDEEGEYKVFTIQFSKEIGNGKTLEIPGGLFVTGKTRVFECKISVNNMNKKIILYCNQEEWIWKMTIPQSN